MPAFAAALPRATSTGSNDFAETNQFGDDAAHRIDGNRETDSRRYARRTVDRRVDADQTAGAVEQGAAGISWIDRRVGLNHPLDRPPRQRFDFAIKRADHAGGKRLVETEGITDGINTLANLQVFRCAQRNRG